MLRKSIPFLTPCYDMCTIYSVKSNNFILCPNKETGNVTSDAFIVTQACGIFILSKSPFYLKCRCTRSSINDIILPKFHLDVAKKSFYYHGAMTFNSLPMNIKTLPRKERSLDISTFYS